MTARRRFKIPQSVLVVIHTAQLEVLLLERADVPGFWQSVTGSKDRRDEPLVETCRREVGEETGIVIGREPEAGARCRPIAVEPTARAGPGAAPVPSGLGEAAGPAVHADCLRDWQMCNVYDIYPTWRHRYAPGVTRNTEHVFGLRVPRETPLRLAPREHLRFEWFEWRLAADRCSSASNAEAILLLPRFLD